MDSLEELKQELELQKTAITNKGGVVQTAYTHPSPSEITAGINSISSPDLSLANATQNDVAQGKTFYAGDNTLKTGSFIQPDSTTFKEMFLYHNPDSTSTYYFTADTGVTSIRPYLFCQSPHKMQVTLVPSITEIGEYAFGECDDMTITNFNVLTNLQTVGDYAFYGAKNIDLEDLPNTVTSIGAYAFCNTGENSSKIIVGSNVATLGQQAFRSTTTKVEHDEFVSNSPYITTLPVYTVANRKFDCDFTVPSTVDIVGQYFNYGGCFKNIIFSQGVGFIYTFSFGAPSTDPVEFFNTQTVTFMDPDVPSMMTNTFADQYIGKVSFYVPDNSLDEYKSSSGLSKFNGYVYPMSQKP